jgi:hypothetical protein
VLYIGLEGGKLKCGAIDYFTAVVVRLSIELFGNNRENWGVPLFRNVFFRLIVRTKYSKYGVCCRTT